MSDSYDRESDERKSRERLDSQERVSLQDGATQEAAVPGAPYSSKMLDTSQKRGRGNTSTHNALMQRAQRTHGNRAVQRFLTGATSAPLSIQRDIFDGLGIGDWKILPPSPKTETDDSQDNAENQRREQRKVEDERGKSATPEEWWKPKPQPDLKAPPPWMPKVRIKEPPGEIDIPPKGPDERGDYPIPPWPEDEGYA